MKYAVVKVNGAFAGVPCDSLEEAYELSAQHPGSFIYEMNVSDSQVWWEMKKKS